MERARWILIGAAMVLLAVAFSWSCGGGGGAAIPCPTYPGGVPITACAVASPAGPFLQAISLCPGPPPSPTPASTGSAAPTPMETACTAQIVTAVPLVSPPAPQPTVQFHAVGTFTDGSTQDITNGGSTTWTSDDPSVVTANTTPPGSYSPESTGCANVNASSGGISGSPAVVDVEPVPASTVCPAPVPVPTSGTALGR
jgi:hypothetical protein